MRLRRGLILAPDWACEVLSPATRRLDLVDKRPVYAREGVPHLWLVDPADRTYRVTVRASKTNQDGAPDVRFIKNGAGRALAAIRPDNAQPTDSVFGLSGQSIGRRFSAAARRAGFRATAHSARVTLASELTRLGASAQEVMKAGAWKTSRMVAHYSAGVDAEAGAVAKYL